MLEKWKVIVWNVSSQEQSSSRGLLLCNSTTLSFHSSQLTEKYFILLDMALQMGTKLHQTYDPVCQYDCCAMLIIGVFVACLVATSVIEHALSSCHSMITRQLTPLRSKPNLQIKLNNLSQFNILLKKKVVPPTMEMTTIAPLSLFYS